MSNILLAEFGVIFMSWSISSNVLRLGVYKSVKIGSDQYLNLCQSKIIPTIVLQSISLLQILPNHIIEFYLTKLNPRYIPTYEIFAV